jgi:HD-GYP domain-containing protein (c-di-GMP phosphodiesterase class II)
VLDTKASAKDGSVPTDARNDEINSLRSEIENLREDLRRSERQIDDFRALEAQMLMAQIQTVEVIVTALEARDEYTSGHSRRVAELSLLIGAGVKLRAERMWKLNIAALLHDVGKIGVYDSSLRKTTRLNDEEFLQLKEHPIIGERIINKIDFFSDIAPLVRSHHERYDGRGYPDQLKGDQIPVESAIICVADAYDAITSKRTYNNPMSPTDAVDEIENNAGSQFSPSVVESLRNALRPNDLGAYSLDENDFVDFEFPESTNPDS